MRNHLREFLSITVIGLLVFQTGVIYFLYDAYLREKNEIQEVAGEAIQKNTKVEELEKIIKDPTKTERENMDAVPKKPKDVEDLFITGWVPDWDIPEGTASMNRQDFDGISPVFFWIEKDGSLKTNQYTNNQEFLITARNKQLEVIPTITLFDPDIMSTVLATEESRQAHIDEIMGYVLENDYDGIDLDYEAIYLKDKEKFFDLLEKISIELAKNEKKFVFTVMPKWGNDVFYNALPQTRLIQDYGRIAQLTDEFRIMTYEFSARDGERVGPIAPLSWMEDTIRYALLEGVPREKLVLGIHTYSYDYLKRPLEGEISYYPVFDPKGTDKKPQAAAYFPRNIESLNFETTEFNEEWGEMIGIYKDDENNERVVIYPTQRSIDLRKQLAADYGLKGVAYWRVGAEGSIIY